MKTLQTDGELTQMFMFEKELLVPIAPPNSKVLFHFSEQLRNWNKKDELPLRFAITSSDEENYRCEAGVLVGLEENRFRNINSIFQFFPRKLQDNSSFNVVLLVPTGIGAEIGGHAGDATPVANLLAASCDTLITHPNVVTASDINEIPSNGLFVEGSIISRLLMGAIGLQKVRSNRVMVVIDAHLDDIFVNSAVNSVSALRATLGLSCPRVVQLDPPVQLIASYTSTGRAAGRIEKLEPLLKVLEEYEGEYDAVAISSVIKVPHHFHAEYFLSKGNMVNPWGGVEAMLTHTISTLFNVPSAHAPMFESEGIANMDPGVIDPRMAAEAVSVTFLQGLLKGLARSPRIVSDPIEKTHPSVLTAANISCLVIPDGCLGLPTLAALEQGIPVIAVKENKNLMRNELSSLPWRTGQFYRVENYWEAAGVMTAIKAGVPPETVRRPFPPTRVDKKYIPEKPEIDNVGVDAENLNGTETEKDPSHKFVSTKK